MKRIESLWSLAAMMSANSSALFADPAGGAALGSSITDFRYVIPVGPFRVGILSAGTIVVARRGSAGTTSLNIPRPEPGSKGWRAAAPPATPYVNADRSDSDVIMGPEPDAISAASAVGPHALFGVVPGPLVPIRAFLLRVTPSTLQMQTHVLPPTFDSSPIAFYLNKGILTVIDVAGKPTYLDYP